MEKIIELRFGCCTEHPYQPNRRREIIKFINQLPSSEPVLDDNTPISKQEATEAMALVKEANMMATKFRREADLEENMGKIINLADRLRIKS